MNQWYFYNIRCNTFLGVNPFKILSLVIYHWYFKQKENHFNILNICKTQNHDVFQLRIVASDGGIPSLSSTATVQITVTRNLNAPRFTQTDTIRAEIKDNAAPGTRIANVTATDADREVRKVISIYKFKSSLQKYNYLKWLLML